MNRELPQNDRIVIHRLTFKQGISLEEIMNELAAAKSITDNYKWNLSANKYCLYSMSSLLPLIQQARIQQLYLSHIESSNISTFPFLHIKFQLLQALTLWNNIQSIQQLIKLDAPQLSILWLGHNKITNIKPLRKLQTFKLEWLSIHDNPIAQYGSLCELKAKNLKGVDFGQLLLLAPPKLLLINWLAKIQSQMLTHATLQLSHIKISKPYLRVIKAKFADSFYS